MFWLLLLRSISSACPVGHHNVTIADPMKPIVAAKAYYACGTLTSVTIEDGHTEIATEAFYGCSELTHVFLPNTITTIGDSAFYVCKKLEYINLEEGITHIGDNAIRCTCYRNLTLPSTLTSFGGLICLDNDNLEYIEFRKPNKKFHIEYNTTMLTSNKKTLYFVIGGAKEILIPPTVTTINGHAFAFCRAVQERIIIPDAVTSVGGRLCYTVNTIDTIELGANVKLAGTAFEMWTALKNIIISPNNTYYSSDSAGIMYTKGFTTLTGYPTARTDTTITIPAETVNFTEGIFGANGYLKEIIVNESNPFLTSYDGIVYTKTTPLELVVCPPGKYGSHVVRNGTVAIRGYGFYRSRLSEVIFTDEVLEYVGYAAFSWTSKIVTVDLADSVSYIGPHAFSCAGAIRTLRIPYQITHLLEYAYRGCSLMTNVTLEGNVTHLDTSAFDNCKNLTSFTFPETVEVIGASAFYMCVELGNVVFPSKSLRIIGKGAFEDCINFTEIFIPQCVFHIQDMAFARCINIGVAIIENCGTIVSKTAFAYVPNLQPKCVDTAFFTDVMLFQSVKFEIMKLAVISAVMFIYMLQLL